MAEIDPTSAKPAAEAVRKAAPVSMDGIGATLAAGKPPTTSATAGTKEKLTAIAQGGTAGLKQYETAQSILNQSRQLALSRATDRSRLIGGPESQGFEAFTEGEFGRRQADLAQAGNAARIAGGHRQAAIDNYRKALQAGIPLSMAAGKSAGEAAAAKANKGNEDFVARALGQAKLDEDAAAANLQKGRGDIEALNKERSNFDFQISTVENMIKQIDDETKENQEQLRSLRTAPALQGVGPRRTIKQLEEEISGDQRRKERLQGAKVKWETRRSEWDRTKGEQLKTRTKEIGEQESFTPETRAQRAREIAIRQLNVDPALATGKIGVEEDSVSKTPKGPALDAHLMSQAKISAKDLQEVRANEQYTKVAGQLERAVAVLPKEEALQLINLVGDPKVRAVLKAQFEGEFLTAAQLKKAEEG
jgi:hypothetical protein